MGLETIFSQIDADVKSQCFAQIPCRLSRNDVVDAAETFLDFLTLPMSVKKSLSLPSHTKSGADLGYIWKVKEQGAYETKEFFHYNPMIDETAETLHNKTVTRFTDYARYVFANAYRTLLDLLDVIEKREPGVRRKFVTDGMPTCYLRFLCYPEGQGTAANGHYDKGAFTLSLAESAPGLQIEGKPANNREYNAILMPGITSTEIAPQLGWQKSWHDAVYDGTPYKSGVGRWAIVFFSNDLNQRLISSEETHTRATRKPF